MTTSTAQPKTRLRLLEAAGEVFAGEGYEGATVRAICRRAKANVAAVNYHFGDKEALYLEVFQHAFETIHERTPIVLPEGEASLREQLEAFVGGFLQRLLTAGDSWHGRLMARELAAPGPALRKVTQNFVRPHIELLQGLIAGARPDLQPDQLELHALSLIGQCVFFRHARPILDVLYGPERYTRPDLTRIRDHIVTLFLHGLELPAEEPL